MVINERDRRNPCPFLKFTISRLAEGGGVRFKCVLMLHLQLILLRGNMLIAFKYFDKIAAVIKAAVISDGSDRGIGRTKQGTGAFNPVVVQVVHGCPVGDGLEIPAEVFGRHPGNLGKLLKGNAGGIVLFDIFKYRLELIHMPKRGLTAGNAFDIVLFMENKPKHFEKGTDNGQFIAAWHFCHSGKYPVDDAA